VTRSLFKLMSYKDEYEVARLHSATDFIAQLKQQFEGKVRVTYHLAPPFMPGPKDERGRPRKREFGPWIGPVFRCLARLKFLRGTSFDVFGYTAERRMERELVVWFEEAATRVAGRLNAINLDEATAIMRLPMEIRGYGPIKAAAAERIRGEAERRLTELDRKDTPRAPPRAAA
jgi:indolepyruvate ferredoxin oxidoreductase